MTTIRGVSHVSLSVRDLETSASWYRDVLGLDVLAPPFERETYRETMLRLPDGMALCLQAHHANEGEPFRESRTGLDHLALLVPSYEELDAWAGHLNDKGVSYSDYPIGAFGRVIVFRDPDNIQLELHALAPRGEASLAVAEP